MKRVANKIIVSLAKKMLVFSLTLVFLAGNFAPLAPTMRAEAAFNAQINYQGKLTNASNVAVADGVYHMKFWLLTSPTAATTTAIWTEDRSTVAGNRVTVSNGLFSVMLGSSTPLTNIDFNQTLYLGVEIGGSGGSPAWDGEMSPRKVLGAVPAAFEAGRLDGVSSEQFFRNDITNATSSATTSLSIAQNGAGKIAEFFGAGGASAFSVLSNGNIGIGTTTPGTVLSLGTTGTNTINIDTTATSTFGTGINIRSGCFAVNGVCVGGSGTVAFGTTGQFPYYTGSGVTVTGTSTLFVSQASFIGIGSTTPSARLSVTGAGTGTGRAFVVSDSANAERFTILENGNVGIGTVTPGTALDVVGGIQATGVIQSVSGIFRGDDQYHQIIFHNGGNSTDYIEWGDTITNNGGHRFYTGGASPLLRFQVADDGSYFSGNVGVGSTTPWGLLSVNPNDITGPSFVVGSSTATQFIVTNGGNVGIGTTSPYALLSVAGTGVIEQLNVLDSSLGADNSTFVRPGQVTINDEDFIAVLDLNDSAIFEDDHNVLGLGSGLFFESKNEFNDANSDIHFGNSAGNIWTELMLLPVTGNIVLNKSTTVNGDLITNSTGKIGIGTTSPYASLSVNGRGVFNQDVRANYFTSTSTSVASVFPYASTTAISVSSLSSGRVPFSSTGGLLTDASGFTYSAGTLSVPTQIQISTTGTTPALYNPTSGNGLILRGDSAGGQLRIVSNAGGWTDAQTTTYFQMTNGTNNNATFMGGTYGTDVQLNRLQFNASSSQFTDLSYASTPVPGSILEAINSTAAKTIFKIRGATAQSGDYVNVNSVSGTSGDIFNIKSSGRIGVGTTTPGTVLSLGNTGTNTINIDTTATSTFGTGINIRSGCFAINGTCVGGSSGTVNSGTTGQFAYYAANGTALTGTSTIFVSTASNVGVGSTTPSARLSVTGSGTGTGRAFVVSDSANAERLTVLDNGNVGVGSTSPSARLSLTTTGAGPLTGVYSHLNATGDGVNKIAGKFYSSGNGTADFIYGVYSEAYGVGDPNAVYALYGVAGSTNGTGVYGSGFTGVQAASNALGGYAVHATQSNSSGYAVYSTGGRNYFSGNVGVGSTTPWGLLSVNPNGITGPSFVVGSSTATRFIVSNGGNVGIGTTTPGTVLSLGTTGTNTINIDTTATSTFGTGINIRSGCFAINGTCVGGSSGTVNSGTTGQFAYYAANGTALTGTSALFLDTTGNIGIGTTSPYAKLSVVGETVAEYFTATSTSATSTFRHLKTDYLSTANNSASLITSFKSLWIAGNEDSLRLGGPNDQYAAGFITTIDEEFLIYGGRPNESSSGGRLSISGGGGGSSGNTNGGVLQLNGGSANGLGTEGYVRVGGGAPTLTLDADGLFVNDKFDVAGQTYFGGTVGVGSTSPWARLSVSTASQQSGLLPLFTVASTTKATLFNVLGNGNTGIGGTTTPGTVLSLGTTGTNTINIDTAATSTFGTGIDIRSGCFAINGTCVGGSSGSGTVNSGTTGQFAYYAANGTALTGTSTILVSTASNVAIGTTTPLAKLHIDGGSGVPLRISSSNIEVAQFVGTGLYSGFRVAAGTGGIPYIALNTGATYSGSSVGTQQAFFAFGLNTSNFASLGYGASTDAIGFMTTGGNVGNVGIATSSPLARLSVKGAGTGTGRAFVVTNSSNVEMFRVLDNGTAYVGNTLQAAGGIYYPDGNIFMDNSNTINYGDGNNLADAGGNLYYGNSTRLADSTGTLYYSFSSLPLSGNDGLEQDYLYYPYNTNMGLGNNKLADFNILYYPSGVPLGDISGNLYDGHNSSQVFLSSGTLNLRNRWISNDGGSEGLRIDNSGNVSVGTSTVYSRFTVWGNATGSTTLANFVNSASTTVLSMLHNGNVGIGVANPVVRFNVVNPNATGQTRLSYDSTNYSDFIVDATGDIVLDATGGDFRLLDENLMVCASGACPTGSPSGRGNIIAETAIGVGSSTPFAAISVGADGSIVTTEKSVSASASMSINWLQGNQQKVTLNQAGHSISFTNYIPGQTLRLVLCQDGSGGRTTTWDSAILWAGGAAPTLSTAANKCDVTTFMATAATGTVRIFGSSILGF